MSRYVLDSSALMALINREPGAAVVRQALASRSAMSTVNLAEVVTRLTERGLTPDQIDDMLLDFDLNTVDFDPTLAMVTGLLRPLTRHAGLSLGDRACLALAQQLQLPVLTADRAWQAVSVGVDIRLIR